MPTTTNFGWTTPADTDYVKDGANAIRTLGNGIDTSLLDLKGGTTGQILSKASNTDLDYTWINNDQGDITAVNAGTGISVTGGTGPTPTVAIDSTVATLTGSQTLTNKTIALGSNTVSGTTAQFNTALTDGDFTTLAGTETLTNKTLTSPKISLAYSAKTDTYTVADGDQSALFTMNAATAKKFQIPTDATFNFAVGTVINFAWITGAGQPSIEAVTPATTTILSTGATSTAPKLRLVNSAASAIKLAANSWLVVGDIA